MQCGVPGVSLGHLYLWMTYNTIGMNGTYAQCGLHGSSLGENYCHTKSIYGPFVLCESCYESIVHK